MHCSSVMEPIRCRMLDLCEGRVSGLQYWSMHCCTSCKFCDGEVDMMRVGDDDDDDGELVCLCCFFEIFRPQINNKRSAPVEKE